MIAGTCPRCGATLSVESYAHPLIHCGILFWVVDPAAGDDDRLIVSTDGRTGSVVVWGAGAIDRAELTNPTICNALRFVSETRIPRDFTESIEDCPDAERPWFAHELKQHAQFAADVYPSLFYSGVHRWSVRGRWREGAIGFDGCAVRDALTTLITRWSQDNHDGSIFVVSIESADGYILPESGRRREFDHGMLSARQVAVFGEGPTDDPQTALDAALAYFCPPRRVALADWDQRLVTQRQSPWHTG